MKKSYKGGNTDEKTRQRSQMFADVEKYNKYGERDFESVEDMESQYNDNNFFNSMKAQIAAQEANVNKA